MSLSEDPSEAAVAYEAHFARVYRFLLRRTRDPHLAEELTQQVFADAVLALSRAETRPHTLVGWLYRVAERRFVDELRRRGPLGALRVEIAGPVETFPGYGRFVAKALRKGIEQLPEDQRTVVVQHLLEDRSHAEIVARLGISEDACKMRFSRALRQLRASLTEQGIES